MDVRTVGGTTRLQPDFTRVNELAVRTERLPRRERDGVLPFPGAMWLWVGLSTLLRLAVWAAAAVLGVAVVAAAAVQPGVPGPVLFATAAALLVALLVRVGRGLRRRSEASRQAAVAREYWSWRRPPVRFEREPAALDLPSWLSDPMHRRLLRVVRPRRIAPHADRVSWAHRWARSRELRAVVPRLTGVTALAAVLTVAAWRAGWLSVHAPAAVPADVELGDRVPNPDVLAALDVVVAAVADYTWHLVDMVPLLGLADVLGWARPAALASGGLQDGLAVVFRLAVLLILAATAAAMLGRRVDVDAKPPLLAGQVERALVEELVKARRLLEGGTGRHDQRLFDAACRRLRTDAVALPAPYEQWTAESLCHALALEQSWMSDWRVPEQRSVLS
ncbi:hypothetical protein [Catellatospora sichuanensis]|uniref:hypothetical protein n=1 Tax=Catellatospora sichuanensis TaxID=1969805 RepID=UPI001183D007|nr:hypothetical protein [Catellatospora sichuanensis]